MALKAVGSFLRSVRELQHLSQEQVAEISGTGPWRVSRSAISAIERGRNLPSLEGLIALSRVLHVDPLEVIERAELGPDRDPVDVTDVSFEELDSRARDLFWQGDYRAALAHYDAMLEQVALSPPEDASELTRRQATVELRRAAALRRCGTLLAARSAAERAISLAGNEPGIQAQAYTLLSTVHVQMDNLTLAQDMADRAVALAAGGDAKIRARSLINRGVVLMRVPRYEDARAMFVEARKEAKRASDDRHLPHIEGNLGLCWLKLGRRKQARSRFTQAIKVARKLGLPGIEASWLVELGRAAVADDDLETADNCATAALRIANPAKQWLTVFRAEWLRHLIVRRRRPGARDGKRLAYLKKLLPRLEDFRTEEAIREFRAEERDSREEPRRT